MTDLIWSYSKKQDEFRRFMEEYKHNEMYYVDLLKPAIVTGKFEINSEHIKQFNHELFTILLENDADESRIIIFNLIIDIVKQYNFFTKPFKLSFTHPLEKLNCFVNTQSEIPLDSSEVHELTHLSQIENNKLLGQTVKVRAIVSSNSISYQVPCKLEVRCLSQEKNHSCAGTLTVELLPEQMAEYVEQTNAKKTQTSLNYAKAKFSTNCHIYITKQHDEVIRKFRIRPVVRTLELSAEKKVVDELGNEYKNYDIYLTQDEINNLEAGKEIELIGTIIPDPKTQRLTLIASHAKKIEDREINLDKIKELKIFNDGKTVEQIMEFYISEFDNYSKIRKRHNVTRTGLFIFFSPLYITFENETKNAWGLGTIIGDPRTGKSDSIKKMIVLLKAGQYITVEVAKMTGILGSSQQSSGGQWFVQWGFLPLQDGGLLVIDGAHMLSAKEWGELAETESSGVATIVKASQASTNARTRQLKILNPVDEFRTIKAMKSFYHPVQAVEKAFHTQTIARQHLLSCVPNDVSAYEINQRNSLDYNPILNNLSDLLNFCWHGKYSVRIEENALDEILKQSTILANKFYYEDIPLITKADTKFKLASICASVACLTCSINESFTEIIVKKEHIDYVVKHITDEYHEIGLDILAQSEREATIDDESFGQIIRQLKEVFRKREVDNNFIYNILTYIAPKIRFSKDDVKGKFSLSRDNELAPLLAVLKDLEIIKTGKEGYYPTPFGIKLGKYINECGLISSSTVVKPTMSKLEDANQTCLEDN